MVVIIYVHVSFALRNTKDKTPTTYVKYFIFILVQCLLLFKKKPEH